MALRLSRRGFVRLGAGAAAVTLAACRTPAPRSGVPDLTFVHLAPIPVQVARREFVDLYVPPAGMPTIESRAPIAPSEAVRRWAEQRIRPAGANGAAVVTVHDAMLAEIPLARTTGVTGALTVDQSEEYRIRIDVEIVASGLPNTTQVGARAFAERSRTVREDVTLQQREEVQYRLVEEAMIALNAELERQILANFGPYLG
ncbi:MAG: hypothetical protein R3F55_23330 [Alphaproteobacteria bacterium]